ncbi:MAG: class I SAM-dependent rRNA methyltransferase [Victivallaceae bacterium]|nr:class I SAM-dependent rRNA methyltransferase [Victivallaceae bacterium]
MSMKEVRLARGKEQPVENRHPWIFSGAVASVDNGLAPGETCLVRTADGKAAAVGAWSPKSQIRVRVWSFDPAETIDGDFFRKKIQAANALRTDLGLNAPSGGCRIVYSESDGLPGVIADRYGEFVVFQLLSAGAELHREEIAKALLELPGVRGVHEKADASARRHEGIADRPCIEMGDKAPAEIIVTENGLKFAVDVKNGQKTGFYFDLCDARKRVMALAKGRNVLNMFCYTGGFAVAAAAGGAKSTLNVDSSASALRLAQHNMELNGLADAKAEFVEADAFDKLRELQESNRKFDLIILDPPKLIDSRNHLVSGSRAYQFLASTAFRMLNPGGILINFSCSGLMTQELLQKITFSAALNAGVDASLIGVLRQGADHPVALTVPETFYLKGFISKAR